MRKARARTQRACLSFLAVFLALQGWAETPDKAAKVPFVRVRWHNSSLQITYAGKTSMYDFRKGNSQTPDKAYKSFYPAQIEQLKTEQLFEKDGTIYMLLDIQSASRGPEGASHYCGAGSESAKVLFTIASNGTIREPQIANYESCLASIESMMDEIDTQASTGAGRLVAKFSYSVVSRAPAHRNYNPMDWDDVTVEVRFDEHRPEAGLKFQETLQPRATPGQK